MKKNYVVEILFTLLLFMIFVIGSFLIVVYTANVYENMNRQNKEVNNVRLPLSYISKKYMQSYNDDSFYLTTIDGIDCIAIEEDMDNITLLFYRDHYLYELLCNSNNIDLNVAYRLFEVSDMAFYAYDDHIEVKVNNDSIYLGGKKHE